MSRSKEVKGIWRRRRRRRRRLVKGHESLKAWARREGIGYYLNVEKWAETKGLVGADWPPF